MPSSNILLRLSSGIRGIIGIRGRRGQTNLLSADVPIAAVLQRHVAVVRLPQRILLLTVVFFNEPKFPIWWVVKTTTTTSTTKKRKKFQTDPFHSSRLISWLTIWGSGSNSLLNSSICTSHSLNIPSMRSPGSTNGRVRCEEDEEDEEEEEEEEEVKEGNQFAAA